MPATMTQIAKEAGVSLATVSRLLRGDRSLRVTTTTRQRVLSTCDRLGGLRPRRGDTRSKRSRACHIAVPVNRCYAAHPSAIKLLSSAMCRSLDNALRGSMGQLDIVFFDEDRRVEMIHNLIDTPGACEGLLLLNGVSHPDITRRLNERRFPHVSADPHDHRAMLNTIWADETGGVRQAVEHLKSLGHERICYLGPVSPRTRYPLFVSVMVEAGLAWEPALVCAVEHRWVSEDPAPWRDIARDAFARWLTEHDMPAAIYCHNDHIALAAVDVVRARGLEPGRDVAIVGYDDIEGRGELGEHEPMLTTVHNPLEEIGRHIAQRLLDQIDRGQHQIVHEHLPMRLVVRRSTAPEANNP